VEIENVTPQFELICVGNELLIGKVVNTNASWLSRRITELGGNVRRVVVVGDSLDEISQSLKSALERKPFMVITTGGLGPTYDDMTLEGVARALGVPLEENPEALKMIQDKYASLSLELTPARRKMARLPKGSAALPNPVGMAPGCLAEHGGTKIVCLPGVPSEMEAIFSQSVEPIITKASGGLVFREGSLIVRGIPESGLAPILDEVRKKNPLAYFKSHPKRHEGKPLIEIHVSNTSESKEAAEKIVRDGMKDLIEALKSCGAEIVWGL